MLPDCGTKESGSCEKSLNSSQLGAFLEAKVERVNLTSDAHKWQAVIKLGEQEARHVQRRCREMSVLFAPESSCLWHLVQVQVQVPSIIDDSSVKSLMQSFARFNLVSVCAAQVGRYVNVKLR